MTTPLEYFPYEKYNPRPAQVEVLEKIEKAIKRGKKCIIIQAPTGVGKSAIAVALGRYFDTSYICTSQIALQKQYTSEFPEIKQTKGRNNFVCLEQYDPKKQKNISCDGGLCKKGKDCERKPRKEKTKYFAAKSASRGSLYWPSEIKPCEYWNDKIICMNSPINCHNYKYLLTESRFVGDFGKRTVLIADEGHNIESNIIDMIKVDISYNTLNLIMKYSDNEYQFIGLSPEMSNESKLELYLKWLEELNEELPFVMNKVSAEIEMHLYRTESIFKYKGDEQKRFLINNLDDFTRGIISSGKGIQAGENRESNVTLTPSKITQDDIQTWYEIEKNRVEDSGKEKERLEELTKRINFLLGDIEVNKKWVVMETYFPDLNIKSVIFQPLFVKQYAQDMFFSLGDTAIIMSATILNPNKLAHDLGIDRKDFIYIKIQPQFPVDSNRIYNLNVANFSSKAIGKNKRDFWKKVTGKIDLILDHHKSEKGIIHTHTHETALDIKALSKYSERIIIHSDNADPDSLDYRQTKIDEHCNADNPTILCSPSMTEGVDLKDDLSRFQIIVKMPKPDWGNDWIRARVDADKRWYNYKTAITICQAIGRSVRNKDDWCVTYTLDSRFVSEYGKRFDEPLRELYDRHVKQIDELNKTWDKKKLDGLLKKITN